jgi:hypothetical protein
MGEKPLGRDNATPGDCKATAGGDEAALMLGKGALMRSHATSWCDEGTEKASHVITGLDEARLKLDEFSSEGGHLTAKGDEETSGLDEFIPGRGEGTAEGGHFIQWRDEFSPEAAEFTPKADEPTPTGDEARPKTDEVTAEGDESSQGAREHRVSIPLQFGCSSGLTLAAR